MTNQPPPPITPQQFIALLEEMYLVAFCEKRTKQGRTVYSLSVDDIYECEDILAGLFRTESH